MQKPLPSCIGTAYGFANAPAVPQGYFVAACSGSGVCDGLLSGATLFGVFLIELLPLPLRCRACPITQIFFAGRSHTSVCLWEVPCLLGFEANLFQRKRRDGFKEQARQCMGCFVNSCCERAEMAMETNAAGIGSRKRSR